MTENQLYGITCPPVYYLNNYFNFHVCLSIRVSSVFRLPSVPCFQKLDPIPAVVSQNVINKRCLICIKRKNYWSLLDPCRVHEKLNYVHYINWQGDAFFSISSPHQCWSHEVVCVITPKMQPQRGYFLVDYQKNKTENAIHSYIAGQGY